MGLKGNPVLNKRVDCDVLVAEVSGRVRVWVQILGSGLGPKVRVRVRFMGNPVVNKRVDCSVVAAGVRVGVGGKKGFTKEGGVRG